MSTNTSAAEETTKVNNGKLRRWRKAKVLRPLRAPVRGWRGKGGGQMLSFDPPPSYRGTTVQVCGLWPWVAGSGTPMVGVPLGLHLQTGATLCCDPISWFQRANLISNPSAFVLGKPGLGKSTIVRRMVTGLAGMGVIPLVLGDLKPDYVKLVRALGGQVIQLGHGLGWLNILDPGESHSAADGIEAAAVAAAERGDEDEAHRLRQIRAGLLSDAHSRRQTMVTALITIVRNEPPNEREQAIITRALRVLDDEFDGVPVLSDLLDVIRRAPDAVRQVALDRGDDDRYREITENLEASLQGLLGDGPFGDTFARHTSEPMRRDRAIVFDVHNIDDNETDLQAGALLACWSAGFGMVNVAHALADAGLEARRHYFCVLDELWRALRAGRGMVDRVDALTRLNRTKGVGMAMISHTLADLRALPSEEDRAKAKGFVERSGMVICAGLPSSEMPELTQVVPYSAQEQKMIISWQDPPAWDSRRGREAEPPGRGKFLVKVGGRPGIPLRVHLTDDERIVNDTDEMWDHSVSRRHTAAVS